MLATEGAQEKALTTMNKLGLKALLMNQTGQLGDATHRGLLFHRDKDQPIPSFQSLTGKQEIAHAIADLCLGWHQGSTHQ